jgi:hypothetical protein
MKCNRTKELTRDWRAPLATFFDDLEVWNLRRAVQVTRMI